MYRDPDALRYDASRLRAFWVTPPCLAGEYVVKGTGIDYVEHVRTDVAHRHVPKIEAVCWTRLRGLSLADKHVATAAYIKAVCAGESSLSRNVNYWEHVFVDPDGCLDFVDPVIRMKACFEGIEKEVPAADVIAALPQLLAS